MLFQIQVLPNYSNEIVWIFDEPGSYTIRSTEYSGPEHPSMVVPDAITVVL
jgi:cytochrome c oxidase subunit 2